MGWHPFLTKEMATPRLGAWRVLIALILAALLLPALPMAEGEHPTAELSIGGARLTVEIPADRNALRRGLMHRKHLPDDRGMLFVWPDAAERGMWMLNTLIPLDVAFIDEDYVITNIETMRPETTDMHNAERPVRYALEVNAGWFERHGVDAGDRIPGLETILRPEK